MITTILLTILTTTTYSYVLTAPIKIKSTILFFTGGNSLMSPDIYSSFINKFKNDYEITVIKNSNDNSNNIIEQLFEYSSKPEIIPIGHSSGCNTLLNYCTKLNNVNKCVLLDPVSNNLKNDILQNLNLDSILQINAEKSYKWKMNENFPMYFLPKKLPFIPAFALDASKLNKNIDLTQIEVKEFGHCDILDTAFSNIMHNTFAEGVDDRSKINDYKNFLFSLIHNYIQNYNDNDNDYIINNLNKYDIDFNIL